jgi:hypothetical protein
MSEFTQQCGRYLWSPDIEPQDWIAPDDYDGFLSQHSLGTIYHCTGAEAPYIVLQANRHDRFRVNPQGFAPVPTTDHFVGDNVTILSGSKSGKSARIEAMGWHTNKQKIIYILSVNGKRSSRQYWEDEFEPSNQD